MSWEIIQADARRLPFGDDSVDLIVTSPPYWGLRSYQDGGNHCGGQFGSESTPEEYVTELVRMIDSEWRRVLRDTGSLWLNLGDKYAGSRGGNDDTGLGNVRGGQSNAIDRRGNPRRYPQARGRVRQKSLFGLPWRVALLLIDGGWILRAPVVWHKQGMPESVKDRVRTTDQEMFFHFVLDPYFADVDEIREPHGDWVEKRTAEHRAAAGATYRQKVLVPGARPHSFRVEQMAHPAGRLPGSVWRINNEPLTVPEGLGLTGHFAAFPTELARIPVLGFSPAGGVVLDPMCGTGTVPGVAHVLGRHGVGVDLSGDYCRLARWRIGHSGHFDKVYQRAWSARQGTIELSEEVS